MNAEVTPGKFITLEGGEGAGKSTQLRLLAERLTKQGIEIVCTREPGGTPGAEVVRQLLKSGALEPLGPFAETLMISAARDDHLNEVIRPALSSGKWVICDRFADSTRAYQGAASGVGPEIIDALERIVVGKDQPDLTLLLDIPIAKGMARAKKRAQDDGEDVKDRFEKQKSKFHEKLHKAFHELANKNPDRIVVVDADHPKRIVSNKIWKIVQNRLMA